MAKRGGQPGNTNATKGKPWRDALDWALENHPRSKVAQAQALRDIATQLIDSALDGDMSAIKEIGDRMDGKSSQEISGTVNHEHNHEHRAISETTRFIEEAIGEGSDTAPSESLPH